MSDSPFPERFRRLRDAMADASIDVAIVTLGSDMRWLTGYNALVLERLTALVLPVDADPTLIVPALEAPGVPDRGDLFAIHPWQDGEDPVAILETAIGGAGHVAFGDNAPAGFLVDMWQRLSGTTLTRVSALLGPLRAVKDEAEMAALAGVCERVDIVARALHGGEIVLAGRTEADIGHEIVERILAAGHDTVEFIIVASGPNASSPHHEVSDRVIGENEVVLCDFGGSLRDDFGVPYCSDITRCVHTGKPTAEFAEMYDVLFMAQEAGVAAASVSRPAEEVDAAARHVIAEAGYGEYFIHRLGHGIGVDVHEDPYIVEGNQAALLAGNVHSVEPGIYIPGRWGARIEDIVAVTDQGPTRLNSVDRSLPSVA